MLQVTDAERGLVSLPPSGLLRIGGHGSGLATLLAVDTLRRTVEVLGLRVHVVGVPTGLDDLNIRAADTIGPVDVLLYREEELTIPPYGDPLGVRLAWLAGTTPEEAQAELAMWRGLVAGWAERPSEAMAIDVRDEVLQPLCDDLDTRRAVDALRASTEADLSEGCLFETWVWVDRLLGLDLARDVGR